MRFHYNFAMHKPALAASLAAILVSTPAGAFKIDPWSYRPFGVSPRGIESQLESFIYNPRILLLGPLSMGTRLPAAMAQLKEAAHENLTELSIRCVRAPLARGELRVHAAAVPATPSALSVPASQHTFSAPASLTASGMITRCAGRAGALQSHASDLGEEMEEVIRAVRFNDAPPVKTARALMTLVTPSALLCGEVRVPENAGCWAMLMAHAAGLAQTDPANAQFGRGGNFLYRSHFGDMQFMHAMAGRGETLAQARERLLLWAQFTYQVAGGEIATDTLIGALPAFASIFGGFETVTVAEFFEIRGGTAPERIRRIALGALLHTLQDSFAEGHAERETSGPVHTATGAAAPVERFGAISAMRDFTCQSDEKHGAADRAAHYAWFGAATHQEKSPVTLGAQLIDLLEHKVKWDGALTAGSTFAGSSTVLTAGAAPAGSAAFTSGGAPAGSSAAPTVAHYFRDALFPIVTANAALVAGAGAQFARVKPMETATRAGSGILSTALADEVPGRSGISACKE